MADNQHTSHCINTVDDVIFMWMMLYLCGGCYIYLFFKLTFHADMQT